MASDKSKVAIKGAPRNRAPKKNKQSRLLADRGRRDFREVFAELIEGKLGIKTALSVRAMDLVSANADDWSTFLAFVVALRRRSVRDLRLLAKMRETVREHMSVDERRVLFADLIAHTAAGPNKEDAAEMIAARIAVELERTNSERDPDDDWPLEEVRQEIAALKMPDPSKPTFKRGGRGQRGPDSIAAALSRRFGLFGDSEHQTNDAVAARYAAARQRTHGKKKGYGIS